MEITGAPCPRRSRVRTVRSRVCSTPVEPFGRLRGREHGIGRSGVGGIGRRGRASAFEGTVEDVWVRATVLRTCHNRRALIPNAVLFVDKVTVITAHDKRRQAFPPTIGTWKARRGGRDELGEVGA